jgi:regulator of PEP synthase PpsR (kinase-PPPase family)
MSQGDRCRDAVIKRPRPARRVFYVSGGTGLTAEAMGHSLLSQFPAITVKSETLPFVKTKAQADQAVQHIRHCAGIDAEPPLVFTTLVSDSLRDIISGSPGLVLDLFGTFMEQLQGALGVAPSHIAGRSHSIRDPSVYRIRIDALHYALKNDDGAPGARYDEADIVLVGLSRSGKTPTSLYMALQFGLKVANYPLTEEDLNRARLPDVLAHNRHKAFALTLTPARLATIRHERHPRSRYASLRQCQTETRSLSRLLQSAEIPSLDVSTLSIEEISSTILARTGLARRLI